MQATRLTDTRPPAQGAPSLRVSPHGVLGWTALLASSTASWWPAYAPGWPAVAGAVAGGALIAWQAGK